MKSEKTLIRKCNELAVELQIVKTEYSNLHQIDKLSGEGIVLLQRIARLDGQMIMIKWVLK